jgi:hypothetical protein
MDRFELEQSILDCWHVADDIDLLYTAVLEKNLSTDEISNVLLGLSSIYSLKFDKLFSIYETLVKEGKFK